MTPHPIDEQPAWRAVRSHGKANYAFAVRQHRDRERATHGRSEEEKPMKGHTYGSQDGFIVKREADVADEISQQVP
jgi:hypothetical protein